MLLTTVVVGVRHGFDDDEYAEFSKQVQDRIIGTKEGTAHVRVFAASL